MNHSKQLAETLTETRFQAFGYARIDTSMLGSAENTPSAFNQLGWLTMNILPYKEVREISLTRNKVAIVDSLDFEYLNQWKWYASRPKKDDRFYACRRPYVPNGGKVVTIRMHRVVLEYHGIDTSNLLVDHIDGNSLNNCFSNLRLATPTENARNRPKNLNSTSVYKRVCKSSKTNAWTSIIEANGERIYLGCFPSPEEAALAYNQAAIKYFGEFAQLNEIPEETKFSKNPNCLICGKELRRDNKISYCVAHRKRGLKIIESCVGEK